MSDTDNQAPEGADQPAQQDAPQAMDQQSADPSLADAAAQADAQTDPADTLTMTVEAPPAEPPFPSVIRFEAGHAEHFMKWLHDWTEWKFEEMRAVFQARSHADYVKLKEAMDAQSSGENQNSGQSQQ